MGSSETGKYGAKVVKGIQKAWNLVISSQRHTSPIVLPSLQKCEVTLIAQNPQQLNLQAGGEYICMVLQN